ncbi:hypothetical protein [Erwinia tracheiphila]|nr:hypothetical protein [Erwinia tracheiphila]EOS92750.1 hypothetical protein ETR_22896 [Erwinia tracheiphila PSU-1]
MSVMIAVSVVATGTGLIKTAVNINNSAALRKTCCNSAKSWLEFQMAEGFIDGCLSMLDVELEMDKKF